MKKLSMLMISGLLILSCQKKEEDKKSSKAPDASEAARDAAKEKSKKEKKNPKDEKAGSESSLVNSAELNYTLLGGKSNIKIKAAISNPCMIFNAKINEGQYSLNLNFADKENANSIEVVSKANQSLLKELFAFAADNMEKQNATLDGMNNFSFGDAQLKLKVKEETFTSDKCDISAKPRLYKTDYDYPGYEIDLICKNVKQTGLAEGGKNDGEFKMTAYCGLNAQK